MNTIKKILLKPVVIFFELFRHLLQLIGLCIDLPFKISAIIIASIFFIVGIIFYPLTKRSSKFKDFINWWIDHSFNTNFIIYNWVKEEWDF